MANNNQSRSTFIKSSIRIALIYGFDCLDLDWEIPNTAQDMSNLASLFEEWRQAIEIESKSYGRLDWIGYEGPTSIAKKIEYAKYEGLGEYFF
ncbi:hypothetical protein Dsin_008804 [Dipteronia sinensis]|uniref:GH18 domain-containing protein n=1 Tax=Dipteronia sinensis TaxID=43782 RepID=A0AAE0AQI5_9ROSI|nr:hypothetical protein Dsin_008804 [Dipteronia sinensis]